MIKLITKVLITALALMLASHLVSGIVVDGLYVAILTAVILGLLNLIAKPILVILTLPITVITLGLFIFVINAGLFLFASSFIEGFYVENFITALIGSLLVTVVSTLGNKFV